MGRKPNSIEDKAKRTYIVLNEILLTELEEFSKTNKKSVTKILREFIEFGLASGLLQLYISKEENKKSKAKLKLTINQMYEVYTKEEKKFMNFLESIKEDF